MEKKIKNNINLKKVNENAFIEDYFEKNSSYIENYRDLYNNSNFNETDELLLKKINKKYKDIIRNPKDYFNYNFNIHDYSKYISKNIFMRLEKNIIKKNISDLRNYFSKINTSKTKKN